MIKIQNYNTIKKLGQGGMATVYLAQHELLHRDVALKMLTLGAFDPVFRDNFVQEARIAASLKHPNIIDIHNIIIENDQFYIVMEYIKGGTLKQRLKATSLNINEILSLVEQVASALSYAHKKGYIHRDVKPANILLRKDGTSVLADFGIAKRQGTDSEMTLRGYKPGTASYMSPEQSMGIETDTRTDIYSLGIVLYEMLTGEKPFQGENTNSISYKHAHEKVPALPSTYSYLQPVLNKALEKRKEDRYPDTVSFISNLHDLHKKFQERQQERKQRNKQPTTVPNTTQIPESITDKPKKNQPKWLKLKIAMPLLVLLASVYYFISEQKNYKESVSIVGTSIVKIAPSTLLSEKNTHNKNEVNKEILNNLKKLNSEKNKDKKEEAKKGAAKKAATEKANAKKAAAKKATAKKVAAKKAAAKKATAKKAAAKKATAKKAAAKKAAAKKAAAKKAAAKKAAAKKAAKKAAAKKTKPKVKKTKRSNTKKNKPKTAKSNTKRTKSNIIDNFIKEEKNKKQFYQKKWQQEKRLRQQQRAKARAKKIADAKKSAAAKKKIADAKKRAAAKKKSSNAYHENEDDEYLF